MHKTSNILLTQSTKYVYIQMIYISRLLWGCFIVQIKIWLMWTTFAHFVYVCFAVDPGTVALGCATEPPEVCCR